MVYKSADSVPRVFLCHVALSHDSTTDLKGEGLFRLPCWLFFLHLWFLYFLPKIRGRGKGKGEGERDKGGRVCSHPWTHPLDLPLLSQVVFRLYTSYKSTNLAGYFQICLEDNFLQSSVILLKLILPKLQLHERMFKSGQEALIFLSQRNFWAAFCLWSKTGRKPLII